MEDEEKVVKRDTIAVEGGLLEIGLVEYEVETGKGWYITVDDVEWCDCADLHHALILFDLIRDHATEYVKYILKDRED